MAHIDFAIAFVVVFTMIAYSVFLVSGVIERDFEHFDMKRLQASYDSLSKQLFQTLDNKSLMSTFKEIEVNLEEVGGYQHTENIDISIEPAVNNVHVYNKTMQEIGSSVSSTENYTNISFSMEFNADEEKYLSIFYSGVDVEETSYSGENVTARIMSGEDIIVLSQEKCNILKGLDYDAVRESFGFTHRFRIEDHCVYGEDPPEAANIIVKTIPLLVERTDGTIQVEQVTLKVW